ncbi:tartrate dehydrogenase [Delitschia confertaspora ATCC 74209]|uniref:D-malate dehydrogenase (decarboxylating) n=1 Tax=Delitschia confertaspora ATCC 74209 TaxID=1513339 RepID=A0A9P4JRK9_9PLEO|nr:tartrate dehydrogenase [Delitschia confertaspora ATCC 74209]
MSPSAIHSTSKVHTIACIPGDGIGVDITEAAVQVLQKLSQTLGAFEFDFTTFDWSSEKYKERGWYMPEDGLEQLKKFDAIYFGAVGWPDVPDHISLWSLILPIRKALSQYVNVRPTRILRGTESPLMKCSRSDLDWIIIRENSEGEYSGQGGTTHENTPFATATEVSIFTQPAIERIMRFAFETAKSRPRKKLTMVTKSNAQRHGMVLWDKVFYQIKEEYPDVETDKMLVDAMTVRMVLHPQSLDTIVATNLHADILSDLAAALSGSIGIAPSSNLDPTRKNPSMFEPIHGSAPDIAGKGIANPVGAFWSAAEMVRWLGYGEAADGLMECIENVTGAGIKTKDLGGFEGTKRVTDAVCAEIEKTLGQKQ